MAETVYIPFPFETVTEAAKQPSKTYRLDLDNGRIIGLIDEQEAVQQAIRKAIITPRFKCLIYNGQYGCEVEEAISRNDVTREYIETAVPGFVRDALKPDTRILKVYNFSFSYDKDKAYIAFCADTIFGKINISEVIA